MGGTTRGTDNHEGTDQLQVQRLIWLNHAVSFDPPARTQARTRELENVPHSARGRVNPGTDPGPPVVGVPTTVCKATTRSTASENGNSVTPINPATKTPGT